MIGAAENRRTVVDMLGASRSFSSCIWPLQLGEYVLQDFDHVPLILLRPVDQNVQAVTFKKAMLSPAALAERGGK